MSLLKSRFIEMFGNLGNHHKDWKIAKFENFCEINPNKKSIENIEDSTEVSFIPMAAVSEKGEIDTSETKTYSEVKKGFTSFSDKDVLFAKITPCMENGKGAVAEGLKNNLGFGSTEFHVLRPKQELCDSYWLYYLMSLPEFRKKAELNMKGSAGQKRVPANFLAKFEISLPPIGLQKVYIDFFNQIDKSKFLLQQILEKFELLKKSRFIEMFGDVINNKKTWPTKRWSYVLNIVNGKNQKKVECENGIYPICGSGGKIGKTNEYLTKENSVIIGRKGNINNPILMKTKFWNVDTAFGLEPNNKDINVEYLYKFCELFDFQRLNKTVTIPSLTKSDLLKIEIPVPPMKLQEEYRNFLAQVDKSKLIIQKALEDLVGKV